MHSLYDELQKGLLLSRLLKLRVEGKRGGGQPYCCYGLKN